MESAVIFLVFLGSVYYLSQNTFKAFFAKSDKGCAKGCGSCGAVDFEKIAKQIEMQK
jgi:hypothetical protein